MNNTSGTKLNYFFDREADVLYFSKRRSRASDTSEEVSDDVIVRRDSRTNEVVGFTVLNFVARQRARETSIALPLEVQFVAR